MVAAKIPFRNVYQSNMMEQVMRDATGDLSYGAAISETNYETAQEWDLKNTAGIPVAGGLYIIHIKADGLGEKNIKWFGAMRPIDLDTF